MKCQSLNVAGELPEGSTPLGNLTATLPAPKLPAYRPPEKTATPFRAGPAARLPPHREGHFDWAGSDRRHFYALECLMSRVKEKKLQWPKKNIGCTEGTRGGGGWRASSARTPRAGTDAIQRNEEENMNAKNRICLWYDKDAEAAARFYAATFPNSQVIAVHKAPGRLPGRQGAMSSRWSSPSSDTRLGFNGGPTFKQSEAFSFQVATEDQKETTLLERDRRQRRPGKRMRLVQGPLGPLLADHPADADRGDGGGRRQGEARVRGDDALDEED